MSAGKTILLVLLMAIPAMAQEFSACRVDPNAIHEVAAQKVGTRRFTWRAVGTLDGLTMAQQRALIERSCKRIEAVCNVDLVETANGTLQIIAAPKSEMLYWANVRDPATGKVVRKVQWAGGMQSGNWVKITKGSANATPGRPRLGDNRPTEGILIHEIALHYMMRQRNHPPGAGCIFSAGSANELCANDIAMLQARFGKPIKPPIKPPQLGKISNQVGIKALTNAVRAIDVVLAPEIKKPTNQQNLQVRRALILAKVKLLNERQGLR